MSEGDVACGRNGDGAEEDVGVEVDGEDDGEGQTLSQASEPNRITQPIVSG